MFYVNLFFLCREWVQILDNESILQTKPWCIKDGHVVLLHEMVKEKDLCKLRNLMKKLFFLESSREMGRSFEVTGDVVTSI